jgi:hypothetical protein
MPWCPEHWVADSRPSLATAAPPDTSRDWKSENTEENKSCKSVVHEDNRKKVSTGVEISQTGNPGKH